MPAEGPRCFGHWDRSQNDINHRPMWVRDLTHDRPLISLYLLCGKGIN